jgi:hypothetical protein
MRTTAPFSFYSRQLYVNALADALFIFRENRKCIHDDLAGTKVIQINRS